MPGKQQTTPARPPGTEAMFNVTCKDVVMGRGSGTQNHCGNVTYRKLVFLNKELYATSTKFDKLKISKAIVATVREFGGFFLQADEKRGGLYFDIGDKRAWDKTSQALREGQAEVRARLAEEDPAGMSKVAEYKDVISGQTFFAFACRMMESLLHPDGEGGSSACGGDCPHAKRRHTLNQLGANPMQIHNAMHSLSPPPLPPVQGGQPYLMGAANGMQNNVQQQYNNNAGMMNQIPPNANSFEPLPYNAASAAPQGSNFDPLPYTAAPNQYDPNALPPTEVSAMLNDAGIQKPGLMYDRGTSNGTVFSLRKFCSEDFEMSSEEGKELMDQLNAEVDQLIRRKSHGLIQIDTTEAFEDLVFEEDSMMFDTDLRGVEPLKNEASENAAQSKGGLGASALTYKDDMSLMNMSILSLDERGESTRGLSTKDGDTPKSILNDSSTAPRDMRKRGTRVSFAGKNRNISLMSMDERSFSKLVDTISDPENVVNEERNMSGLSSDSSKSVSRKMGFPMRKSVAKKFENGNGPPTEVVEPTPITSQEDKVSSLSLEDSPVKNESTFNKLAGKVANPGPGVTNSLTVPGYDNISALNMSTMSLDHEGIEGIDPDSELLK